MTSIYNRHDELEKRRRLRRDITRTEAILWANLRGKACEGLKVRRQYSVNFYVLDFYAPSLKLAIEIDGPTHDGDDAQDYDAIRQREIEALGICFLRFTNEEVYKNLDGVLIALSLKIRELQSLPPSDGNAPPPAPP